MTAIPPERLTRAADTLDRMADAATPCPWEADISTHKVKPIIGKTFARTVAFMPGLVDDDGVYGQFYNPEDARLIALTSDPVTVRLIAALLREEADVMGEWPNPKSLALADHINERSGP